MYNTTEMSIIDSLKFYSEEMVQWNDSVDTLFDESYFLFILTTRYKDFFETGIQREYSSKIENRKYEVFLFLECYFKKQRNQLGNKSLFEKSQFWFNFLGFTYLKTLESPGYSIELTIEERKEIEKGYGYSTTYDYMMNFFLKKNQQNVSCRKVSVPLENEKVYIATHKFLLESDYFSKEIAVEENTEELLNFLDDVLMEKDEDLLAEILWALNYFEVWEFPQRQEIESMLESCLFKLTTPKEDGLSRKEKHTVYACIFSFMEKELKAADECG